MFPYLPWTFERLLWPRRTPLLLEFDDAIWLTFAHRAKLQAACARADMVLVGNDELAAFARGSARRVTVVPTTIDMARYPAAPPPPADGRPLRLGWIGLRYNLEYLALLAPALRRLAAAGVPVELRVISSGPPEGPEWHGVPVVHRPWSEAGEVAEIQACDVGLMPLPDDAWARGKCGLKLLQFMAAGRPVVASPVGVNARIVQDGENGLLAADEARWESALLLLAGDPGLRRRLGAAGRDTVEREYSLSGWATRLAETYRQAAGR
jgi:glycosyltransferase involved in cell wall biosynthesis